MSNIVPVEFQSMSGDIVRLDAKTVRDVITNGDGAKVTDKEVTLFLELCKFQKLNPFLKEAYLIKFGTSPATMVTGKEAYMKRAVAHRLYDGHEAGVSPDGQIAWAKVYKKGLRMPISIEVNLNEYLGTKADGSINAQWKKRPRTMLRKVALCQCLREAFPNELGAMYTEDEVDIKPQTVEDADHIADLDSSIKPVDGAVVDAEFVAEELKPAEPIVPAPSKSTRSGMTHAGDVDPLAGVNAPVDAGLVIDCASDKQIKAIHAIMKSRGIVDRDAIIEEAQAILAISGLQSIKDLSKDQASDVIKKNQEIAKAGL